MEWLCGGEGFDFGKDINFTSNLLWEGMTGEFRGLL